MFGLLVLSVIAGLFFAVFVAFSLIERCDHIGTATAISFLAVRLLTVIASP